MGAVDDDQEEGVDLLNFAPQPSYLSYIQGPLYISAADEVGPPLGLASPLTMFMYNETGTGTLDVAIPPYGGDRGLVDQFENLEIYNLDVKGEAASVGVLTDTNFTGFNMASGVVIEGAPQADGITYSGVKVVEIRLGDLTVESVPVNSSLLVRTRGEVDTLYFNGLADGALANVYGGDAKRRFRV